MRFRYEKGKKGPDDLKLFVETNGEEIPKMTDVAIQVVSWYNNEQRIYPPVYGYKGGRYFLDFLLECIEICRELSETQYQQAIQQVADRFLIPKRGVIKTT